MEARLCRRPDESEEDRQRGFWSETAMGSLIASAAARLAAQGDDRTAQGVAR